MTPPLMKFWADFARTHWMKAPTVFRDPGIGPPASPERIFEMLVRGTEAAGPGVATEVKLFLDGKVQPQPNPAWMPRAEDGTFSGYGRRLKAETGAREYCLMLNFLEAVDFEFWRWLRDFSGPLFQQLGMNNFGVQSNLFVGEYARTPFGVHDDNDSVFTLCVEGKKKFRLWSPEVIEENPGLIGGFEYGAINDRSTVLEIGPGEWMYWPTTHWHIAEAEPGLNVSIALGYFTREDISQLFFSPFGREYFRQFMKDGDPPMAAGADAFLPLPPGEFHPTAGALPPFLGRLSDWLTTLFNRRGFTMFWLKMASAMGAVMSPPPLPDVALKDGDRFAAADPRYPALLAEVGDGEVAIGANGHAQVVPAHPGWAPLLAQLSSGRAFTAAELKGELPPAADVQTVLTWLLSVRFLAVR